MTAGLFSLKGRTALVTGSSQGIGLAIARGLCEAGAAVVLNGRSVEKVAAAAKALRSDGHTVHEHPFDVSKPAEVERAVERIEREAGPVSILVNNAGHTRRGPLHEITDEAWREVMGLNLDGIFYVSKHVARRMISRQSGSIINICSVMSELARPTTAPYAASKGGAKMLTKGMAIDWGRHGIRVNGIGPGYFKTELNEALVKDEVFSKWVAGRTPLGRWGDLPELVGAAVFLASDAASFVTGHILYVDGGMTASV
ncbi:MAG: glucose 1-dehydrogenase [Hyphomicrobiales bacterium]|nr:glucose 1-dehydrogenase [Hyphomicrobiales bacterium]